jgi:hypothetical protein
MVTGRRTQGIVKDQNGMESYTQPTIRRYLVTTVMRLYILKKAEKFLTKVLLVSQGLYSKELVTYSRG